MIYILHRQNILPIRIQCQEILPEAHFAYISKLTQLQNNQKIALKSWMWGTLFRWVNTMGFNKKNSCRAFCSNRFTPWQQTFHSQILLTHCTSCLDKRTRRCMNTHLDKTRCTMPRIYSRRCMNTNRDNTTCTMPRIYSDNTMFKLSKFNQ
jgi:hypothetical protein